MRAFHPENSPVSWFSHELFLLHGCITFISEFSVRMVQSIHLLFEASAFSVVNIDKSRYCSSILKLVVLLFYVVAVQSR